MYHSGAIQKGNIMPEKIFTEEERTFSNIIKKYKRVEFAGKNPIMFYTEHFLGTGSDEQISNFIINKNGVKPVTIYEYELKQIRVIW